MKYFKKKEFQGYFEFLHKDLKTGLDAVRGECRIPQLRIAISKAKGAVGRYAGPNERTYHNLDVHNWCMAVDVMPYVLEDGVNKRPLTKAEAEEFERCASKYFNGIGIYPFWEPRPGFHLDIRDTRARWADTKLTNEDGSRHYVAYQDGLDEWGEVYDADKTD